MLETVRSLLVTTAQEKEVVSGLVLAVWSVRIVSVLLGAHLRAMVVFWRVFFAVGREGLTEYDLEASDGVGVITWFCEGEV